MNLKNLLLQKRAPYVLIELEKAHTSTEIARKLGVVQPNVSTIINNFSNFGLVEKKKVGRECYITLTKKGKRVASAIRKLCEIVKEE